MVIRRVRNKPVTKTRKPKKVSTREQAKRKGMRSGFELKVANTLDCAKVSYLYEDKSHKLTYTVPESTHTYLPDFVVGNFIFEAKGRFLATDRKKMLLVKEQNPSKRIVMVFQNPNLPINKGSKTTYAKWCDKHGIEWCTVDSVVYLAKGMV